MQAFVPLSPSLCLSTGLGSSAWEKEGPGPCGCRSSALSCEQLPGSRPEVPVCQGSQSRVRPGGSRELRASFQNTSTWRVRPGQRLGHAAGWQAHSCLGFFPLRQQLPPFQAPRPWGQSREAPPTELSAEAPGPEAGAELPGPAVCVWEAVQSSPEGRQCGD